MGLGRSRKNLYLMPVFNGEALILIKKIWRQIGYGDKIIKKKIWLRRKPRTHLDGEVCDLEVSELP